jgi:hypothetical protein
MVAKQFYAGIEINVPLVDREAHVGLCSRAPPEMDDGVNKVRLRRGPAESRLLLGGSAKPVLPTVARDRHLHRLGLRAAKCATIGVAITA